MVESTGPNDAMRPIRLRHHNPCPCSVWRDPMNAVTLLDDPQWLSEKLGELFDCPGEFADHIADAIRWSHLPAESDAAWVQSGYRIAQLVRKRLHEAADAEVQKDIDDGNECRSHAVEASSGESVRDALHPYFVEVFNRHGMQP